MNETCMLVQTCMYLPVTCMSHDHILHGVNMEACCLDAGEGYGQEFAACFSILIVLCVVYSTYMQYILP